MVKTILCVSLISGSTSTANTTQYWNPIGGSAPNSVEVNRQTMIRSAATLSNLAVRLTANSLSGGSLTYRSRKDGANGSQSITISAGSTGLFEDTTGTDSISAGNKLCYQSVPPATGTFTLTVVSSIFDATTDTVSKLGGQALDTFAVASATRYNTLAASSSYLLTTENNANVTQRKAGTWKNMCANITGNSRTTTTTITSRKNDANGNLVISISAGTTGFLEDTTNSDTVAVGDTFNFAITTGTGTESMSTRSITAEFVSTSGNGQLCIASPNISPPTITDNTTVYAPISGDLGNTYATTETNVQMSTRAAFTFLELTCLLTQNGVSSASTLRSRVNTANGGQTVSITGSTTGVFNDSSGSDVCDNDDLINYQIVVPSVAGTQTIAIQWISMWSFLSTGINMTNNNTKTYSNKFITKV